MKLKSALGCLGVALLSQCQPPEERPVVVVEEDAVFDVQSPTRLDLLMIGDPDEDLEYFTVRCENWGGKELLFTGNAHPNYPNRWICTDVDY